MRWSLCVWGLSLAACGASATWRPPPPIPPAIPPSEWDTFRTSEAHDAVATTWERRLAPLFAGARGAEVLDVSADGADLLVGTRLGRVREAHRVQRAGGQRRQLTWGTDPVAGAVFVGGGVAFWRDEDGWGTGPARWLRPSPHHAAVQALGSPGLRVVRMVARGERIAFAAAADDGLEIHLVAVTAPAASRRLLADSPGPPVALSDDGRLLLGTSRQSWWIDVDGGPLHGPVPGRPVGWRGGAAVVVEGDTVSTVDDAGAPTPWLTAPSTVVAAAVAPNGRLAFATEDAPTLHLDGEGPIPQPPPGRIVDLRFAAEAPVLAMTWSGRDGSTDALRLRLEEPLTLERWTESEQHPVVPLPERTSLGRHTAWLHRPRTPGPHPVVLCVEGPAHHHPSLGTSWRRGWVHEAGLAVLTFDATPASAEAARAVEAALALVARDPNLDRERVVAFLQTDVIAADAIPPVAGIIDARVPFDGIEPSVAPRAVPSPSLVLGAAAQPRLRIDGPRWTFDAPVVGARYALIDDRRRAIALAVAFAHDRLIAPPDPARSGASRPSR